MLTVFVLIVAVNAPREFPIETLVTIEEGATLSEVSELLEEHSLIGSMFWLNTFTIALGGEREVKAGDYFFEKPVGVFEVARRITAGYYNLTSIKVVIPEGTTSIEMSKLYSEALPQFDANVFLEHAEGEEGYLFPDTYFFLPNVLERDVIDVMRDNFNEKISTVESEIRAFGRPLKDVITMASLLEEEARLMETRRTVAGILWNRLDIDMPLQVDAVFLYINGKNTFELTLDDLAIDSPYNTYRYPGLPIGPITNPGLGSILAAVTPIESDYFFYLSDLNGNMHYAKTFEEHKINKRLFLR